MKTNHPRAPEVAYQISARCAWIEGEKMYSVDCSEADFAEMLEMLEEDGPATMCNFPRTAYDRLQNEGYAETGSPSDPYDAFCAGGE
jgi:hypothetical protein